VVYFAWHHNFDLLLHQNMIAKAS